MIPKSLSRGLLESGLKWTAKAGDEVSFHFSNFGFKTGIVLNIYDSYVKVSFSHYDNRIEQNVKISDCLWLPKLDQLLCEIRQRGWNWMMYEDKGCIKVKLYGPGVDKKFCFADNNLEKSAAHALHWLLNKLAKELTD